VTTSLDPGEGLVHADNSAFFQVDEKYELLGPAFNAWLTEDPVIPSEILSALEE
jgi:hypothetical protein